MSCSRLKLLDIGFLHKVREVERATSFSPILAQPYGGVLRQTLLVSSQAQQLPESTLPLLYVEEALTLRQQIYSALHGTYSMHQSERAGASIFRITDVTGICSCFRNRGYKIQILRQPGIIATEIYL